MLIRSTFISMTHLAPYSDAVSININILNKITTGGDMFFSGHTGLPFLMALIFWRQKNLRYLFLAVSVAFGITALMGHYHYTIDVFAAFFIAYGVYAFSDKLFNNLNIRFHRKIRIHGWKALQEKLKGMRERRSIKNKDKNAKEILCLFVTERKRQ